MGNPVLLVPGGKGQVGFEVTRQAAEYGFTPVPLDLPELDLTDKSSVSAAFAEHKPAAVINCAAYTAVDKAEEDQNTAYAVNRDAVANLAEACAVAGIPLLHISTDYVFDGKGNDAYRETDETGPESIYGKSKLEGEQVLAETLPEHIILRTAWVYGIEGNNFIKTMLRVGQERGALKVVHDQHGSPTHAADIAETLLDMAAQIRDGKNDGYGIYHYTGAGVTTWHDFAAKVFEVLKAERGVKVGLTAITTAEYPTPAARPANSALDCRKIGKVFGIAPKPWQDRVSEATREVISKTQEG